MLSHSTVTVLVLPVCHPRLVTGTFSTILAPSTSRARSIHATGIFLSLHYRFYPKSTCTQIKASWPWPCAFVYGEIAAQPEHQTTTRQHLVPKSLGRQPTRTVGYSTKSVPPTIHPHFTCTGKGSRNIPRLHLVITNSSVKTVASNSQQC